MTPDDRQVYVGLFHILVKDFFVNGHFGDRSTEVAFDTVSVAPGTRHPSELSGRMVHVRLDLNGGGLDGSVIVGGSRETIRELVELKADKASGSLAELDGPDSFDGELGSGAVALFESLAGAVTEMLKGKANLSTSCKVDGGLRFSELNAASRLEEDLDLGDWTIQRVSVRSTAGSGAIFFHVPERFAGDVASAWSKVLEPELARQMLGATATLKAAKPDGAKKAGKFLMVVEDTHVIRRLMTEHLEKSGYTVLQKEDGEGALRRAGLMGDQLSLIILDLKIPGISGLDVARELKSREKTRDIPILVCSSNLNKDALRDLLEIGVREFLVKPFSREVLLSKVVKLAGRP